MLAPDAPTIIVTRLPHCPCDALPTLATSGSAGFDLSAAIADALTLAPGERAAVPTGMIFAIPDGFEGQVRARSGWAHKFGLALTNGVGTIDSDYRGEVAVLLVNLGSADVTIQRGDRVAQLVIAPVVRARFVEGIVDATSRGAGGFGSTGLGA